VRVLVTGGAGYIGSHLADALIKRGDEVLVIDNLSTGRFENIRHLQGHPAFRFINDTILNESLLERMIPSRDLIFHLAAAVGCDIVKIRWPPSIPTCAGPRRSGSRIRY
jgi:UDP-glucose 4-epimerase